uniref:Retrotransposon gag domain-containing protein n=1 Tax=Vitis vinifera TaxID=29760 RepID=A5C307_VITVI|nr:hypothetical protein VITISV_031539 [Vitis vinifera]
MDNFNLQNFRKLRLNLRNPPLCMPFWIRDSGGRHVEIETPHETGLELCLNIMEATPEDQHSHHGQQDNPNALRSMRNHMHPPRMSAPSCIVPPTEQLENEKFYECWERYMEAINACPHHGFDTWLLVSYFYNGMSSSMKQLLETMCEGDFMSKNPKEAMDFLNYVAEVSRGWNEPNRGEVGRMKSQPNALNAKVRDVKAMITLRSGKEVELPTPKPHDETESEKKTKKREKIKGKKQGSGERKEDHDSTVNEDPEKIVINEDVMKKHMPPPFPQVLHGKKGINNASEILEVLRQVKVNIPLLDMIKQVSTYAKFLKDLCTIKKGLNVNKKAFLTEQVSAIIQCKSPVKYKDSGYPIISVMIRGKLVKKALLNLGASVNLLSYSVYKKLGLGELKPTSITLSLVDRSVKIPRGMIEDVLVQVDNFYYLVDFVVLDTNPIVKGTNYVPIILGRPFLATSNAIIDCRNGLMQLTFGNMTLELNIFYMCKKPINPEEEERPEEEAPKFILKPLPTELKYAYLEENKKCLVVISSSLTTPQEECLLEVLRRCKKAIGWQISNLKGISPLACTHHIYMEEEAKLVRQPQRRLNPHMQEVVQAKVLKLLQAGIIYPISDSP